MKTQNGFDNTLGEKSFAKVLPTLSEIPQSHVQRVTVDLQAVAVVAMNAALVAEKPELRPHARASSTRTAHQRMMAPSCP